MKVLLAVDGSDFTHRMLGYVAAHDEMFGSGIDFTVLTVVAPVTPRAAAFLDKATLSSYYEDEAEAVLKPVRAFAGQQGWTVEFARRTGHAGDQVAEFAASGKFDLIVMGSHGHAALANVVFGSVVTRVLAQCKVPVLIIR